jgi:hypothetical protein
LIVRDAYALAARLAIEVWRASGARSLPRLDALCAHFAEQYRVDAQDVKTLARVHVAPSELK